MDWLIEEWVGIWGEVKHRLQQLKQRLCRHGEWLLVPGYEAPQGIQVAGYWTCTNCRLRGPSSTSGWRPNRDWRPSWR